MYRCGDQNQAVQRLLVQTTAMLEAAIGDVSTGIGSDFGYSAIFKDPVDVPYIKAVLQKMADGSPMPVQTYGMPAIRTPILICVKRGDRDPATAQFTSKCTGQETPAVLIPDTPWVVLCPSFFTMKVAPEKVDCPTMNSKGMLFPKYSLIANQASALVRQLAHFYLGPDDLRPEVGDLNEILTAFGDVTRRNARSYEYYAAGKIEFLFSNHPRALG